MALALDPEVAAAIAAQPPDASVLPEGAWRERRERFDAATAAMCARQQLPEDVRVDETQIQGRGGTIIRGRIYSSTGFRTGGLVVYLHGGGHFCCDIEASEPLCHRYASESGATLISVDYRFAPEHPYPCAMEDAYECLVWAAQHATSLGCDARRIAVMGDSAGGGMAAGLALLARDRGGPPITHQVLIYPMLDDRTTTPDPHIKQFLSWDSDDNSTGWRCLLGDKFRTDEVEAYAAPARATVLSGLPPAYIEVGQLDLFRDEDVSFASRLFHAGVPVELSCGRGYLMTSKGWRPSPVWPGGRSRIAREHSGPSEILQDYRLCPESNQTYLTLYPASRVGRVLAVMSAPVWSGRDLRH